jgi:hypothetical protein
MLVYSDSSSGLTIGALKPIRDKVRLLAGKRGKRAGTNQESSRLVSISTQGRQRFKACST